MDYAQDGITSKPKDTDRSKAAEDTDEVSFLIGAHGASATDLAVRLKITVNLWTTTQMQVVAGSPLATKVAVLATVERDTEMARIAGQMGQLRLTPSSSAICCNCFPLSRNNRLSLELH